MLIDRRMCNRDGSYHEQQAIDVTNMDAEFLYRYHDTETGGMAYHGGENRAPTRAMEGLKNPSRVNDRSKIPEIAAKSVAEIEARKAAGERHSIDPDFEPRVREWFKTTTEEEREKAGGYFKVGTTSKALQSIGIKDRRIYFGKAKIAKIVDKPEPEGGHKGNIDVDDIAKIPELLENPVAVVKSKSIDTSIIVISELKALSGATLTAVVELKPRPSGGMDANIQLVVSAYDRSDENLRNLLKASEVLYLAKDKKRTDTWLMSLRVQFPSDQPMYGSIGRVAYEGEKVKSVSGVKIPFVDIPETERHSFNLDDYTIDEILKWSDKDFERAYDALGLGGIDDDILLEDDLDILSVDIHKSVKGRHAVAGVSSPAPRCGGVRGVAAQWGRIADGYRGCPPRVVPVFQGRIGGINMAPENFVVFKNIGYNAHSICPVYRSSPAIELSTVRNDRGGVQ